MSSQPVRPQTRRQPANRRPPTAKKSQIPWIIGGLSVVAGMGVVSFFALILFLFLSVARIPAGVQVAGINLGGMTVEAASELLPEQFGNQPVTATDGDRNWGVSLADLGISLNTEATLAAAENADPNSVVQPVYAIDLTQAQAGLVYLSDLANIEPIPGSNSQPGRAIDIPVMLDRLRVDPTAELLDGVLDLPMIEIEPPEDLNNDNYTGATSTHTVEAGQELGLIARMYNVSMEDIITLNDISDPNLLYVGQALTIPASGVYEPTAADAPPAPNNRGRSILVSISSQRIYAYENGTLVHSHITSTGLPDTPTVLGDYAVYVKYVADDMSGPDYFLPQVPWTMYFFQGYAIHGTYWHNSFGRPMSHGCVNLPVDEAQWFFNFAEVGTPVRVIA